MTCLAEGERVARKPHRCWGCERSIRPGEAYRFSRHVDSDSRPGFATYKECAFCAHRYGRSVTRGKVHLPVKLEDGYPCRGFDAKGLRVVWDDLLSEGDFVAIEHEDFADGAVVRLADGLWVVDPDAPTSRASSGVPADGADPRE